jgi:pimeloyl-ACP methyl ester carboxylesterase
MVDERFFAHRYKATRLAAMVAARPARVVAVCGLAFLSIVVVSAAAGSPALAARDGQEAASAGEEQKVLSADGVEIAFSVDGKGTPALVFVHGWCFDRSYWRNQVPEFAKTFTVVTVDLGGHGESGLGRKDWTVEAFGKDVAAVIEKLGLDRVILIGHSMGGAVIFETARAMPERVVALIGIDTYQDLEQEIPDAAVEQFLAAFKSDFAGTSKAFVRQMFPTGADSALVDSVTAKVLAAPRDVAVSVLGNVLRYKPRGVFEGLKIPVYAVNGDLYPTNLEAAKRQTYSFEVRIVAGCGHFPMLEKPAEFNKLLTETITTIVKK